MVSYRIQVTSLSAELSAERRVTEETRQQAVIAKAEAARYRAQVHIKMEEYSSFHKVCYKEERVGGIRGTFHKPSITPSYYLP